MLDRLPAWSVAKALRGLKPWPRKASSFGLKEVLQIPFVVVVIVRDSEAHDK